MEEQPRPHTSKTKVPTKNNNNIGNHKVIEENKMPIPNGNLLEVLKIEERKATNAIKIALQKNGALEEKLLDINEIKENNIDTNIEDVEIRVRKRIERFI